jgi:hypothetical protein
MTLETAGAVTLVVSAISGIIFAIYKLRPESTRIFVDSAKVSVEMADSDRERLRQDKVVLEAEILRLKTALTHCEDERERLEGGSPT